MCTIDKDDYASVDASDATIKMLTNTLSRCTRTEQQMKADLRGQSIALEWQILCSISEGTWYRNEQQMKTDLRGQSFALEWQIICSVSKGMWYKWCTCRMEVCNTCWGLKVSQAIGVAETNELWLESWEKWQVGDSLGWYSFLEVTFQGA